MIDRNTALEPLSQKVQASKRKIFKTVFDSPHSQWPNLDEAVSRQILTRTLSELAKYSTNFTRKFPEEPVAKRAKKTKLNNDNTKVMTTTPSISPVLVGLNQVTRALESDNLAAILACKDDLSYEHLLYHLPFQARLKNCLPIPLPKGSATELASLLNLPRVTVIGIRAEPELLPFIEYLRVRIPQPTTDLSVYQRLVIHRIPIIPNQAKKAIISRNPRKKLAAKKKK